MEHKTLSQLLIALIRTVVPLLVGSIITFFALPASVGELLQLAAVTLFTALYYLAAFSLSKKWPVLGWLLGYPANPEYTPKHGYGSETRQN